MMNAKEQREWRKKNPEKNKKYHRKYKKRHPKKVKESQRKYCKNNKEKVKEINKKSYNRCRFKKYNMTLDEYNVMLENQNYKCAICGKTKSENGKSFAVDHNHKTGKVRGLLCNHCNVGIGYLGDSAEITAKATAYLIKTK